MNQIPQVEAENIPEVLSFFGVGQLREIAPVNFGIANHNYFVSTDRGEYVVKFLVTQTPENIENDIAIQQQLCQGGVGAPQYLGNGDGEYLYHGPSNLNAVISEKLDGVPPLHMSPELASEIGRHLALFHTAVVELPHPNNAGLLNPEVSGIDADWARELFDQPLPRGIIHGDLHGGNVLVSPLHPDRLVAILDFEEAGENLYLIDLAVTLMAVAAPESEAWTFEPELMLAAKRGYESERPLTAEESEWLPQAIRYASEAWINWFRANGFERYARQHQQRYDGFREFFGDHTAL